MERNGCGVPYRNYRVKLANGKTIIINRGEEDDWGNIQRCFTDWDGKTHKECVGWGDANDWIEIVRVVDLTTGKVYRDRSTIVRWAVNSIWHFVENYSC